MASIGHAEEKFSTLSVGANTYQNVTVTSMSATHAFIKHDKGVASLRLSELPLDAQRTLGYTPPPEVKEESFNPIAQLTDNPAAKAVQERLTEEVNSFASILDAKIIAGLIAVALLLYLFGCYCCLLICRKAEHEPGFLIWVPLLQMIPMFRAAQMSPWNFILLFIPVIQLIPGIMWCFKICKARKKSPWVGLLLLLPFTSLFAFLYLAFADGSSEQAEGGSVIKLQYS